MLPHSKLQHSIGQKATVYGASSPGESHSSRKRSALTHQSGYKNPVEKIKGDSFLKSMTLVNCMEAKEISAQFS